MSGQTLQIRGARPDDREAIRAVTLAAYQEYAAPMRAHWAGYRQNILETIADALPAEQFVAEYEGTIVGTVLLYPAGTAMPPSRAGIVRRSWPEVRLLAVVPGARGHGIGAALMQECVRRAREAGADALTLHTTTMMQTAMRLYARLGFVRASELDFQPAPGVTIEGYRLDLGAGGKGRRPEGGHEQPL